MMTKQNEIKNELLENELIKGFTNTLYYHVCLTEKCFKIFGKHIEMKLDFPVTLDELAALTVIKACNGQIHQRDLAKIILKDRANTGRLLDNLEKDGFIQRTEVIKNGRSARAIAITPIGLETIIKADEIVRPIFQKILDKVSSTETDYVKKILTKLREIIKETIIIDI